MAKNVLRAAFIPEQTEVIWNPAQWKIRERQIRLMPLKSAFLIIVVFRSDHWWRKFMWIGLRFRGLFAETLDKCHRSYKSNRCSLQSIKPNIPLVSSAPFLSRVKLKIKRIITLNTKIDHKNDRWLVNNPKNVPIVKKSNFHVAYRSSKCDSK